MVLKKRDLKKAGSRFQSVANLLRYSDAKRSNSRQYPVINPCRYSGSKRSQGHVEVIISLVLFVGFLIVIFILMSGFFKVKQGPPINHIQKAVIKDINEEIGILSVIVKDAEVDCYSLDEVNDNYGNNFVEIQDSENPRKYTIYYGDFFDSDRVGVISCEGGDDSEGRYTLGVYIEEEIIVYEEIERFVGEYENGYGGLKESLKIGDFDFIFKDIDGNEILSVSGNIPENVNVIAREFPVRVIDKDAKIHELKLNIRAW